MFCALSNLLLVWGTEGTSLLFLHVPASARTLFCLFSRNPPPHHRHPGGRMRGCSPDPNSKRQETRNQGRQNNSEIKGEEGKIHLIKCLSFFFFLFEPSHQKAAVENPSEVKTVISPAHPKPPSVIKVQQITAARRDDCFLSAAADVPSTQRASSPLCSGLHDSQLIGCLVDCLHKFQYEATVPANDLVKKKVPG